MDARRREANPLSKWAALWLVVLAGCHAPRVEPQAPSRLAREVPALWGALRPGPWDVGVRVLAVAGEKAPGASASAARSLQVTVWYPSRTNDGGYPLRYRDYVVLSGTEQRAETSENTGAGEATVAAYQKLLTDNGVPESAVAAWLGAPVAAVRGAPPVTGRFPLVLVAQGRFHSAHHQAVLSEYLASHGFIVATTPSPFRPDAPPVAPPEDVLAGARVQAEDLERTLSALRAQPNVDAAHVAVVGHSFGARAAFLFALRHPETAALVSLDGGIANQQGKDWLTGLADFRPEAFRVPLLHLYQEGDAVVTPDFELMTSLKHTERWLLLLPGLRHADFTSLGAATAVAPELAPPGHAEDTARGWATTAETTRRFLEATVRESADVREALGHSALTHWPAEAP